MIKFFRHIRQRLLSESKFSKYMLYALGEILLVVIGIIIALQINNWNEGQKRDAQEHKMLNELLVNLRADSIDHAINAQWYERTELSAALIVEALESKAAWHDSMAVHYGNLFTHGISTLNTSAFDNLKSIGFNLISNDSIRIALTNLHSINYTLLEKSEKNFAMENGNQVVQPVLLTRLKMDRWFHAVPLDYESLLNDLEFREIVRWRGIAMSYVKNNTNSANSKVSSLMRMIERDLENKEKL